ncbi:MAG: hypothetical protein WD426_10890 [Anditalea sp.]
MKNRDIIILMMAGMVAIACQEEGDPAPREIELIYDFQENEQEWLGGFSDLPEEGQDIYELEISHAPLPPEANSSGNAIRIQGHNRSDDLFMFLKKYVSGLEPSARYRIIYEIELASQYPENSVGIGGSPGGSVFLKAGAATIEPKVEVQAVAGTNYLRMNIDNGNQSQDGTDMYNIGTIGIEGEVYQYELISRGNEVRPFEVSTDTGGGLWLIVGTDSGFEGLTVLYYNNIKVKLEKID